MRPILVGAVLYDPKVSVIWDIIRGFFAAEGCPIDTVFYTNYELQTDALLAGHIDIAWNSPLAWVDARRRSNGGCSALAMRDTDRDRVSHVLVKADAGITSLAGLRGRTLATGAADSPQSTLLPLHLLHGAGLLPGRDFTHKRYDLALGKHGDHVGGELEALRAVQRGEADAAAVLDLNWDAWQADGTASPGQLRVLATTGAFDHCNFTALAAFPAERSRAWVEVLFRMRYDVPEHRAMMDMEGLKAWLPGRTSGYDALEAAVDEQAYALGATS